ncbi:MAG: serine/threonine protein kinase [Deltaproteobacteria bacterium]|nr:MAG: serine/threonine protein kinase [Deltaproteobacteria bacterium]
MSSARRRFRFIKEIAEGGFGKVYLAEQLSADGFSRIVAVKLLHAKWSSHDEVVKRTRDEARLLGLIRHQHIVKVEDLTSIDNKCALVMEYLEGVDLKWMMSFLKKREEAFPRNALFEIMLATCSALDAAYNGRPLQGGEPLRVIHRDIKPSNIFATVNGGVKVLDFGTARANFAEREAKTMALAFGSQGYMAPERMLGEDDTPAADVFSLGVTIVELLTLKPFGRIPPRPNKFKAKVDEKVKELPLDGDPQWAQSVRGLVAKMLEYDPSDRPRAADLIDQFENLAAGAGDMGLRRFCRTLVAEAKAELPDVESGDPLTGHVVDEDESSAFTVGAGGLPNAAPAPSAPIAAAFGQEPSQSAPPPPPPPSGRSPVTPAPPAPIGASLPPAEEEGGGSKMGLIVAGLAGGLLGLLGLVAIGGIGAYFAMGGGGSTPKPAPKPDPEPTEAPTPAPAEDKGCVVEKEGSKEASVDLTLAIDPAGAEVILTQALGFKAEWASGTGECKLKVPEGSYRAHVTPTGKSKIRNTDFDVTGSACSFTFDVASKKWKGSCS